jgi:hypothetical protein
MRMRVTDGIQPYIGGSRRGGGGEIHGDRNPTPLSSENSTKIDIMVKIMHFKHGTPSLKTPNNSGPPLPTPVKNPWIHHCPYIPDL